MISLGRLCMGRAERRIKSIRNVCNIDAAQSAARCEKSQVFLSRSALLI